MTTKANRDSASQPIGGMTGRPAEPPAWRQTRQQRQREETIDRLLDCSKFILQRDGHAMFTLRAVATHAGVRLSGLQHYFDSKEHLLVETVRQAIESDFNRYRDYALQSDSDPVATLTKILDHAFEIVSDPVETGLMLELWALSRHSPEVHGILQNRFRQYFDIIVRLVQAINSTLDDAAAAAIAEVFIGNLEGLVVTALTMGKMRSDYRTIRANILRSWDALYTRA